MSIPKVPTCHIIAINFPPKQQIVLERALKKSEIAHFECTFNLLWTIPSITADLVFWYVDDANSSKILLKEAVTNNPQTAFITVHKLFGNSEINEFFEWGICDMMTEDAIESVRLHKILSRWFHGRTLMDLPVVKKEKHEVLESQFYAKLKKKMSSNLHSKEGISGILESLLEYTGMDIAEGWIPTHNNNQLTKLATSHIETPHTNTFIRICNLKFTTPGKGLSGTAWESGKIEIWDSFKQCKNFLRVYNAKRARIQFAIAVPIFFKGGIEGVIVLLSGVTPQNLDYLKEFLAGFSSQYGNEFQQLKAAI